MVSNFTLWSMFWCILDCVIAAAMHELLDNFVLYSWSLRVLNPESSDQWTRLVPLCHTTWHLQQIVGVIIVLRRSFSIRSIIWVCESCKFESSRIQQGYRFTQGVRNCHAPQTLISLASHHITSHLFYIYVGCDWLLRLIANIWFYCLTCGDTFLRNDRLW